MADAEDPATASSPPPQPAPEAAAAAAPASATEEGDATATTTTVATTASTTTAKDGKPNAEDDRPADEPSAPAASAAGPADQSAAPQAAAAAPEAKEATPSAGAAGMEEEAPTIKTEEGAAKEESAPPAAAEAASDPAAPSEGAPPTAADADALQQQQQHLLAQQQAQLQQAYAQMTEEEQQQFHQQQLLQAQQAYMQQQAYLQGYGAPPGAMYANLAGAGGYPAYYYAQQAQQAAAAAAAAGMPAGGDPQQQQQQEPQQQEQQRVLRVEDALTYLDEVKRQFGDQPQVYNSFLEIMKNFKAETIDTPGVIERVSELFRGHNALILGFNTFLPAGFRIEAESLPPDASSTAANYQLQQQQQAAAAAAAAAARFGPIADPRFVAMQTQQILPQGYPGQPYGVVPMGMPPAGYLPSEALQQEAGMMGGNNPSDQPAEFDQAISYVTKIKRRFASDAETYKQFLEILHTYQKDQKSIKEVLDLVSELFKDHTDLLHEFTFFLPDAVKEKAKYEISKISQQRKRKEEHRQKRHQQQQHRSQAAAAAAQQQQAATSSSSQALLGGSGLPHGLLNVPPPQPSNYHSIGAPLSHPPRHQVGVSVLQDDGTASLVGTDPGQLAMRGRIPRLERRLFSRIKTALGARERWTEFLKILNLFTEEIITRSELIALAQDIFGATHVSLLEEFDHLLASRGATEDVVEDAWFSMPVTDIDFTSSRRCTPSYRALPTNYPRAQCSERTALGRSVLNDTWVSVPTGSEDSTFKSSRKNQYEEALFKCEDDRHELDLAIDTNASTILALIPLQEELSQLQASKLLTSTSRVAMDPRALTVLHLKAIARVYGERAEEMFELLRRAPFAAIPVILARLREKDEEWRKLRLDLNEEWREILEKNYAKSLDHRSYQFKTNEKKQHTPKSLLTEAQRIMIPVPTPPNAPAPEEPVGMMPLGTTGMQLVVGDAFAHRYARVLLLLGAERFLAKYDFERFKRILDSKTMERVTGFSPSALHSTTTLSRDRHPVGTRVMVRFGCAKLIEYLEGDQQEARVELVYSPGETHLVKTSEAFVEEPAIKSETPEEAGSGEKKEEPRELFVGQAGYTFIRLYYCLCDRLSRAESLCTLADQRPPCPPTKHILLRHRTDNTPPPYQVFQGSVRERFATLFECFRGIVKGTLEANPYEDEVTRLLGLPGYFLYTIDKLVGATLKATIPGLVSTNPEAPVNRLGEASARYLATRRAAALADSYAAATDALAMGSSAAVAVRLTLNRGKGCKPTNGQGAVGTAVGFDEWREQAPGMTLHFLTQDAEIPLTNKLPAEVNPSGLSPVAGADAAAPASEVVVANVHLFVPASVTTKFSTETEEEALATQKAQAAWAEEEDAPASGPKRKLGGAAGPAARKALKTNAGTPAAAILPAPSVNGANVETFVAIYELRDVPGSEEVFRRIYAASKSADADEQEWWKASSRPTTPTNAESDANETKSETMEGATLDDAQSTAS